MIYKNDPQKYGYYEINGHKTFSKLEAIELQNKTGVFPEWNFNRPVFDNINWKAAPLDVWELYKARCKQIRAAYDYVVIFYSGGSDSENILQAWLAADCKLDELATCWNMEGSGDRDAYMNAEVDRVVFPNIKKLKDSGVDFKFRLIDITQPTLDFIRSAGDDYNYFVAHHFSPNNIIKAQLRERIKDYADLINQGKSVCFVWGAEKPQIFPDGDRHYFQFFDIMDSYVNAYTQPNLKQGWYDEIFYWTPDMPEMAVAQAHTLLRFAETCDIAEFYQDTPNRYGYNRRIKKYITSNAAKTILYPTWSNNIFCNGKPTNFIYSERDSWFWNGNADEVEKMRALSQKYFETIGSEWINDGVNIRSGIKCHASPRYYLN